MRDSSTAVMMASWGSLRPALSSHSLCVIEGMGYHSPTPVQHRTIPTFMSNKDVSVEAVTGSGKTLAFVIPIVEGLQTRHQVWTARETGAVIITPTRELAAQVSEVCRSFLPPGLQVRLLIGGRDVEQDVISINKTGSTVVVATPGRLLVLLSRSDCKLTCHVRSLEFLILDEADRLLEMGFQQSLTSILEYLPKQRRTGLFSATLNSDLKQLMKAGLRQPVAISVREPGQEAHSAALPGRLQSYYLECGAERRLSVLVALLATLQSKKVIVFFATCASVSYFCSLVSRLCPQLLVMALHGRMHKKRESVFKSFSTKDSGVLMCTDVVARGIDFIAVDWVLQYDPPSTSNSFIHRSGRTARNGLEGQSLLFLTPSEASYVQFLRLNKGLTLLPYPTVTVHEPCVRENARSLISQDRQLYQLSVRAFVSFVRFYHKHECKLIFQAKALDLLAHARGFALLRLPKMPELKQLDTSTFDSLPVPADDSPAGKKGREKKHTRTEGEGGGKITCGCPQRSSSTKRQQIRKRTPGGRKRPRELLETDLDELARDAKILKKFRKGKITEDELDRLLHID